MDSEGAMMRQTELELECFDVVSLRLWVSQIMLTLPFSFFLVDLLLCKWILTKAFGPLFSTTSEKKSIAGLLGFAPVCGEVDLGCDEHAGPTSLIPPIQARTETFSNSWSYWCHMWGVPVLLQDTWVCNLILKHTSIPCDRLTEQWHAPERKFTKYFHIYYC